MGKIPKNHYKAQTKLIPASDKTVVNSGYPSFSFKYLQLGHSKFNVEDRDKNYFKKVIERLHAISNMRKRELIMSANKTLRCHSIEWSDTTENRFGIADEDQIVDRPWQFSISANEHGRVMGFFINDIFYVVWLDPNHRLYS